MRLITDSDCSYWWGSIGEEEAVLVELETEVEAEAKVEAETNAVAEEGEVTEKSGFSSASLATGLFSANLFIFSLDIWFFFSIGIWFNAKAS